MGLYAWGGCLITQYAYHWGALAAGRLAGFLAAFGLFVPAPRRGLLALVLFDLTGFLFAISHLLRCVWTMHRGQLRTYNFFGSRSSNDKKTLGHFHHLFEVRSFSPLACADRRGEIESRAMHALVVIWFQWVRDWGYPGIILLMAMESSIFPVPSELVIPPAAYWAEQGRYSLWGVVLAGTVGSYLGAAATYWVARWVGRPLVIRYGRYFFVPEAKLLRAERWLGRYEAGSVFFARLLPVVRHLIGIPAGLVRMNFTIYSVMTIIGSAIWCSILAWFGARVIGDQPQLLDNPTEMVNVLGSRFHWIAGLVLALAVLHILVLRLTAKPQAAPEPGQ
jgi:membrane protein DedA with SNARE-associated domain